MRKEINAYQLDKRIFVHSKKGTQSVPAFAEPLYQLSTDEDPILIGKKVRECIEAYQPGSERYTREDWKKVNDPLIKLAGEKSSKAFFKKVLYVPISLINDKLTLFPSVNAGSDGFKNTEHPNIELDYSAATDEDLGKALLKAFELSSIA
ncbi:MAG: contact-dependent growth inhibition system immunity protein [Cyclobacteriaceae bacterium]